MSNPENDPRGPYGAPRQQPGPQYGSPQYGASQYGAPPQYGTPQQHGAPQYGPPQGYPGYAPRPRRTSDPAKPLSPSTSAAAFRSAGIAIGLLAAVRFLVALFVFLGNWSYASPTAADGNGNTAIGTFFDSWLLGVFPFYVGAFLVLAFLAPIARRSALPIVLLRAVLAGAGGAIALAVVGVFTGVTKAVQQNDPSWIVTDVLTNPLWIGIEATSTLVAAAVATWLWLGRPGAVRRPFATPGMPGTVPPADAVPPATVPQNRPQPYGTPVWGQPDRSGGTQPPAPPQQPGGWPAQPPGGASGQQQPGAWPAQQPPAPQQPGAWPAQQQPAPQQPGAWPAQQPGQPPAGGEGPTGR